MAEIPGIFPLETDLAEAILDGELSEEFIEQTALRCNPELLTAAIATQAAQREWLAQHPNKISDGTDMFDA